MGQGGRLACQHARRSPATLKVGLRRAAQRYFVLQASSSTLLYYKSEQDAANGAAEAGSLELKGCQVNPARPRHRSLRPPPTRVSPTPRHILRPLPPGLPQVRRFLRRDSDGPSIRHDDTFVVESFASKRALTLRAEIPGGAASAEMPGAVEWIDALTAAAGSPAQDGGSFSTRPFEQSMRGTTSASMSPRSPSFSSRSPSFSIRQSLVGEKAEVVETMETAQLRESYTKLKTEYAGYKATTQKEVANLREEIRLLCAPPPPAPAPPATAPPATAPPARGLSRPPRPPSHPSTHTPSSVTSPNASHPRPSPPCPSARPSSHPRVAKRA